MDYLLYNNIRNIVKNDLKNINSSLIGGGFDKLPTEDFQKHVIKLLNQLKDYTGYEDLKNKLNKYKGVLTYLDTKLGEETDISGNGYLWTAKQIQQILDPLVDDSDPSKGRIISNLFSSRSGFTQFITNYQTFLDENSWNEDRLALDLEVNNIDSPDKYNIYIKSPDSIDKFNIKLKKLFAPFLNDPNKKIGDNIDEDIRDVDNLISVSKQFSKYINEKKKNIENILESSYLNTDIKFEDNTSNKIKPEEYLIDLQNISNNTELNLASVNSLENNINSIIQFLNVRDEMNAVGNIDIFNSTSDLNTILNIDNAVSLKGGDFESKYYITNSSKKMLNLSKKLEKLFEILDTTLDDAKYLKQLQVRYNFYIAYLFLIIKNSASKLDPADKVEIYEYLPKDKLDLHLEILKKINNSFSNIDLSKTGLVYLNRYHYLTINKLINLLEFIKSNFPSDKHLVKVLVCTGNINSDLILFNHFRLILIKFCKSSEGALYLPSGLTVDKL